jgi:hypothetical protein
MANVKNAVLAGVVQMNDNKLCMRPEYWDPTMTYAEAEAWQTRLREASSSAFPLAPKAH